jgi:hypothetical protein
MTPLPPGKKRRYKSLTVDRVDLVDRGANFDRATGDGSHILLVKRDTTAPPQEPIMPVAETIDVNKAIADALAKQADETKAAIAKAVADAEAKAEAKATEEKAALQKRLDDADAVLKAERETREIAETSAVAKADYGLVLTKADDGGLLYRIRKALPKDDSDRINEILASAQEVARTSALFKEAGRGGQPPVGDPNNAEAAFMAKVASLREADPKLSEPDAVVKARELFPIERQKYDLWKREQVNPTAAR